MSMFDQSEWEETERKESDRQLWGDGAGLFYVQCVKGGTIYFYFPFM